MQLIIEPETSIIDDKMTSLESKQLVDVPLNKTLDFMSDTTDDDKTNNPSSKENDNIENKTDTTDSTNKVDSENLVESNKVSESLENGNTIENSNGNDKIKELCEDDISVSDNDRVKDSGTSQNEAVVCSNECNETSNGNGDVHEKKINTLDDSDDMIFDPEIIKEIEQTELTTEKENSIENFLNINDVENISNVQSNNSVKSNVTDVMEIDEKLDSNTIEGMQSSDNILEVLPLDANNTVGGCVDDVGMDVDPLEKEPIQETEFSPEKAVTIHNTTMDVDTIAQDSKSGNDDVINEYPFSKPNSIVDNNTLKSIDDKELLLESLDSEKSTDILTKENSFKAEKVNEPVSELTNDEDAKTGIKELKKTNQDSVKLKELITELAKVENPIINNAKIKEPDTNSAKAEENIPVSDNVEESITELSKPEESITDKVELDVTEPAKAEETFVGSDKSEELISESVDTEDCIKVAVNAEEAVIESTNVVGPVTDSDNIQSSDNNKIQVSYNDKIKVSDNDKIQVSDSDKIQVSDHDKLHEPSHVQEQTAASIGATLTSVAKEDVISESVELKETTTAHIVDQTNSELTKKVTSIDNIKTILSGSLKTPITLNEMVLDCDSEKKVSSDAISIDKSDDDVVEIKDKHSKDLENKEKNANNKPLQTIAKRNSICSLSNNLDILSDDDDIVEETKKEEPKIKKPVEDNKCINIEDDDDVMLIDEESTTQDSKKDDTTEVKTSATETKKDDSEKVNLTSDVKSPAKQEPTVIDEKVSSPLPDPTTENLDVSEKPADVNKKIEVPKPLIPKNFLEKFKQNVAVMTRDELEEFCLLKIVEGVLDRSSLSDIKTKLKTMQQYVEDWKRKAMTLTKQNRDLQIVVKTVQEEQRKRSNNTITPLKITRSVGMQVFMSETNDKPAGRKKPASEKTAAVRSRAPPQRPVRSTSNNNAIPVPRLVPAAATNSPVKVIKPPPQVQNATVSSNSGKASPLANGLRNTPPPPPPLKVEKRPFSSMQAQQSFTVDLTDDEPPPKQMTTPRNAPQQPVRLVSPQNLLTARAQMNQSVNSPRKVYIPINAPGSNIIRAGQAIFVKSVQSCPRGRALAPGLVRMPANVRLPRPNGIRHPAPLPDAAKQQQPPNWKALPPAPDLKISKVENGIVISWKIEGYQEDSYEEIASYQLYAYQETSSPPNTALWKKIGDVKALPLPMACTLTQFMAGFKYYFAVRAIDIRSRIGPFSLPGSILLLNK